MQHLIDSDDLLSYATAQEAYDAIEAETIGAAAAKAPRSLASRLATGLIHAGVLVMVIWVAAFCPIRLVKSKAEAATAHKVSMMPTENLEIGYGPLPSPDGRVYVVGEDSQRYHWSKDCPILHRPHDLPQPTSEPVRYMTAFQAAQEGRLPCFHCSRVGLDHH